MSFKRFLKQIYRVIRFIPVVWRTFPYDHSSCLELYKEGLKDLKFEIVNGYGANGKKLGHKIDIMINLINRINNEWETYSEFRYNLLNKEFGPSERSFTPLPNKPGFSSWDQNNQRRNTPQFKKRVLQHIKEEAYLQEQDIRMLANMIAKNHARLWD
jgi:hypothetical protein